ncbi:hypothetical protein Hokovirus_1_188 [Hokovirus HKV1]|uniref:Uncharacterized protein n=1 Tax=Hokovirus HKV1 TaxID=1977638 RepID=A0A1V0SF05_9VIRU|nr:hypothetical protein Hokovirus_1_188 [Hokovirus HKV1]
MSRVLIKRILNFGRATEIMTDEKNVFNDIFNLSLSTQLIYIRSKDAYGKGTCRHFYQILINKISKYITIKGYYGYFNDEFWKDEHNIKKSIKIFMMAIYYGCILPFHFHPNIIIKLLKIKPSYKELLEILYWFNNDVYKQVINMTDEEFKTLGLEDDYLNLYDYVYKLLFTDDDINNIIASELNKYLSNNNYTLKDFDNGLSGGYILNVSDMIKIFSLDKIQYQNIWNKFIVSLSDTEIKNMLVKITGSINYNTICDVFICDLRNIDLEIKTCFNKICINERILSSNNIESLKEYFVNDDLDTIYDKF